LSLLDSVETGSVAHPASYKMDSVCSFSKGKVAASLKLTTYLHLVPISRVVELYLHSTVRLHDVMLDELNTGTTLP
jgi:hypothetical protein